MTHFIAPLPLLPSLFSIIPYYTQFPHLNPLLFSQYFNSPLSLLGKSRLPIISSFGMHLGKIPSSQPIPLSFTVSLLLKIKREKPRDLSLTPPLPLCLFHYLLATQINLTVTWTNISSENSSINTARVAHFSQFINNYLQISTLKHLNAQHGDFYAFRSEIFKYEN